MSSLIPRMLYQPMRNEALLRQVISEKESELELEIEPSEVIEVIEKCCKFDNQINLISEAYHLAYGGPKDWLDKDINITEMETPMKNSVLHIAAWNGNDDIVTLLMDYDTSLIYKVNKNNDSTVHVAARGGNTSTVKKILEGHVDFMMEVLKAQLLPNDPVKLDRENDHLIERETIDELLRFVEAKNNQGNTMLHEAMLCEQKNIGGDMIFKVCELFKIENPSGKSLSNSCYEYATDIVNNARKTVLYLAVENGNKDAANLILEKSRNKDEDKPKGLSPVVAAIMMQNYGM